MTDTMPSTPASPSELPLLLLPGTLCDARVFDGLAGAFGGRRTLVPHLAGTTSTVEMAQRILAAAPPRFALVGFSLGAIVAFEIIAQAPERVDRLAIIGGNPRSLPPEQLPVRRQSIANAQANGTLSHIAAVWDASVPASRRDDAELRALLDDMAAATPIADFVDQIELAIGRADSRPRLTSITVPTLVLVGAEDRVCPPELAEETAALIASAKLEVIPDAGHYVTLDQPRAVADALRRWLSHPHSKPQEPPQELS